MLTTNITVPFYILIDYGARWYNQDTGRFLTMDTYPINLQDPVELNRYGYTANNPVNLVDPSGLTAVVGYAKKQSTIDLRSIALLTALTGSVVCVYKLSSSFIGAATEKVLFGGSITLDATTPPCEFQRKPASCDDEGFKNYVKCEKLWAYSDGTIEKAFHDVRRDMQSQRYITKGVRKTNEFPADGGPCADKPGALHAKVVRGTDVCAIIAQCQCCTMENNQPEIKTMCRIISKTYDMCSKRKR